MSDWTREELTRLLDLRREQKSLVQCARIMGRTTSELAGVLASADLSDSIHPEARVRDCKGCGDLFLSNNFGNRYCFWCRQSMSATTTATVYSHIQSSSRKRGAA